MSKHMVVCVSCGRQFDANRGAYFNKSTRRYTCMSCVRKVKRAQRSAQADVREKETGMRQSIGAMIAKIAIGLLFVIVSLSMETAGEVLTGIVIGLALIAWALIPYFKVKRAKKKTEDAKAAKIKAAADAPKRCSACGAITRGNVCEYCGSPLTANYNFAPPVVEEPEPEPAAEPELSVDDILSDLSWLD